METQKISNLLNKSDLGSKKFVTRKWYVIDSQSNNNNYNKADSIKFDRKAIKPNLCDYSEAYILVTGNIQTKNNGDGTPVSFKNYAPFRKCSSYINDEYLEQTEFLDVVMAIYNLIEYSDNYEDSTGSLYHFKRDEITTGNNADVDIAANNSTPFTYRANLVGNNVNNVKLVVPLKYLSNFFRSLEMPLINCKINLELHWTQHCLLISVDGNNNNAVTFSITDTKLYVPKVTLSSKNTSHLSNLLSEGFKRSVFWNKYAIKNEMHNGEIRIDLNSSIQGVNRLFVLPFAAADQDANTANRESYRRFYLPRTSITNYNVLIDGRNFYDQPISSDTRQYDELRKITLRKGYDYTTGCLLDYSYFQRDYKIIAVDLSKRKELDADPRAIQQIHLVGNVAANSYIVTVLEESNETVLQFLVVY